MACILINDEVQSTFSIKDLEKAISDILSTEEQQIIISPEGGIGYISRKEYAERNFSKLIEPTQCQEYIIKDIIDNFRNYKPFSKRLSNE
jgi:hypothetical protein